MTLKTGLYSGYAQIYATTSNKFGQAISTVREKMGFSRLPYKSLENVKQL